eukprot:13536483-Alexandrium_andersonii.AAC.1
MLRPMPHHEDAGLLVQYHRRVRPRRARSDGATAAALLDAQRRQAAQAVDQVVSVHACACA